ncbi:MAG: hypothetical protein SGILL_010807, partial [Bacillariaceae sp.]
MVVGPIVTGEEQTTSSSLAKNVTVSSTKSTTSAFTKVAPNITDGEGRETPPLSLAAARMEEVIRMLFQDPNEAEKYLAMFPLRDFRFYVYDLSNHPYSWDKAAKCINNRAQLPLDDVTNKTISRKAFLKDYCGWGGKICNPIKHSDDKFSTRRLNRDVDLVASQLFAEYQGELRTYDPHEASLFVVSYPSTGWFYCYVPRMKMAQAKTSIKDLTSTLFPFLTFWNDSDASSQQRHLFFQANEGNLQALPDSLVAAMKPHRRYSGGKDVTIPYVNTNREYQPPMLMQQFEDNKFFANKNYSLVSVMNTKISGNGQLRYEFMNRSQELIGDALGGLPVHIADFSNNRRKMIGEQETLRMYRNSIFCPFFRGDSPNQKRIFDVIMSGCIPVAMTHHWLDEKTGMNLTSYFATGNPLSSFMPFAKGTFSGYPNMGIDYRELVVEVDAECGLECMKPTLEA